MQLESKSHFLYSHTIFGEENVTGCNYNLSKKKENTPHSSLSVYDMVISGNCDGVLAPHSLMCDIFSYVFLVDEVSIESF